MNASLDQVVGLLVPIQHGQYLATVIQVVGYFLLFHVLEESRVLKNGKSLLGNWLVDAHLQKVIVDVKESYFLIQNSKKQSFHRSQYFKAVLFISPNEGIFSSSKSGLVKISEAGLGFEFNIVDEEVNIV